MKRAGLLLLLCIASFSPVFGNNLSEQLFSFQAGTTALPSITSITPVSVASGGPGFDLTVRGTNFISGTTVQFNGADRPTTFVNSTELRAALSAADVLSPGSATIRLRNPGGGFSTNTVQLQITENVVLFAHIGEGRTTGGAHRTTLVLVNPSTRAAVATVEFFDTSGNPLSLELEGRGSSSSFSTTVPAGGQVALRTTGTRSPLVAGWARVRSQERISGIILFQFLDTAGNFVSEAAISASPVARHFFVPVEFREGFESALALANTSETETAAITLRLRDVSGTIVAVVTLSLGPRQQNARFLRQLFSTGVTPGLVGTIEVESSVPLTATSVRTVGGIERGTFGVIQTASMPIVIAVEEQQP